MLEVPYEYNGTKTKKTLTTNVDPEVMKEIMTILHALGHCVIDDIRRRFCNPGLMPDLLTVYDIKYDKRAKDQAEPLDALRRVAKNFCKEEGSFPRSLS